MPSRKTSKRSTATPSSTTSESAESHSPFEGGDAHAPVEIPPSLIRANPRNPRRDFDERRIEALALSMQDVGMLVPLTVYEEAGKDGARYTLLDGERRLRAAILSNWATVPSWITSRPTGAGQNTLRMFNIHLMRDEWGDMPTTLALQEIMEETGVTDDRQLSQMTGLQRDMVANMKRVLEFPKEWQDRVLEKKVPFNLLVELDKAIIKKRRDPKKAEVLSQFSEKKLRDFFLKGYDRGLVHNVVDLRNVGTLIDTATSPKNTEQQRRRATEAVEELLHGRTSIEDAYQYGAAASIGFHQVLRDVDNLPGRLRDVAGSDIDSEERARLREALSRLRAEIGDVIKRLS